MKSILTIFASFLFAIDGQSTEQYPDKILLDGEIHELQYCYPLEPFFELHPERKPKDKIFTTALDRGYVATFEVREDSIYVINLEVLIPDTVDELKGPYWLSVIDIVFPSLEDRKLGWINEILVIPPQVEYKLQGDEYTIRILDEHYVFLEVVDGIVVKKVRINRELYDDYKTKMFNVFKETNEYQIIRSKYLPSFGEAEVDEAIRFEVIYLSKHLVE